MSLQNFSHEILKYSEYAKKCETTKKLVTKESTTKLLFDYSMNLLTHVKMTVYI